MRRPALERRRTTPWPSRRIRRRPAHTSRLGRHDELPERARRSGGHFVRRRSARSRPRARRGDPAPARRAFGWPGVARGLRDAGAGADGLRGQRARRLAPPRLAQDRRARRTASSPTGRCLMLVACAAGAGARRGLGSCPTERTSAGSSRSPARSAARSSARRRRGAVALVSATLRRAVRPCRRRAPPSRVACVRPRPAFPPREALPRAPARRAGLGDATRPLYVVAARLVPDKRVACAVARRGARRGRARGAKAPPWLSCWATDGARVARSGARRRPRRTREGRPRDKALAWIDAADALARVPKRGAPSVVREAGALGTPVEHRVTRPLARA